MLALYHTFGCKLNFAETSALADALALRGIGRAPAGTAPDVVVVNSCSVTAEADHKCRQLVASLHRRYPGAPVVVTGCYAQLKPHEAAALPGVALVAGAGQKAALPDMVAALAQRGAAAPEIAVTAARDIRAFAPSCARGDRTRFFLKVQDGCDCWCTYCTIPAARGRSRSPRVADLVEQARHAAALGGREIVLTGVNIGDFGRRNGQTLLDLLQALDKVEEIDRYRISSLEPDLLSDDIIAFCAASRRFMPHFHVPLQSGSDTVLRLMRRRYDSAFFADRVGAIRRALPEAFIGVDVMAGCRGETPECHQQSLAFIEGLDISRLHVFPYSERPGTRALEIPCAVDPGERRRRADQLLDLSRRKLLAFTRRFIGTERTILVEHASPVAPPAGFTDNYLRVEVAPGEGAAAAADNTLRRVRLEGIIMPATAAAEPRVRGRLL